MCIDTLIQQLCCTHRLDQAQWAALLRGAGAQEAEHLAQAAQAEAVARFGKKDLRPRPDRIYQLLQE